MAEASPAGGTGIGLLPGVDQHMSTQMSYLGEEGTSECASGRDRSSLQGRLRPLGKLVFRPGGSGSVPEQSASRTSHICRVSLPNGCDYAFSG